MRTLEVLTRLRAALARLDGSDDGGQAASDRALRAAADSTIDAVFVKDAGGRFVFANPAFCRMVGRPLDEVLGRRNEDLFPPEVARRFHEEDARALATGEDQVYERTVEIGGAEHHLQTAKGLAVHPVTGERHIWGAARDITAIRNTEQALRESHGLLRAIAEGTDDAVYVKDAEGRYLVLNTAGARACGRPVEAILGQRDRDVFGAASAELIRAHDLAVMQADQALTLEERLAMPDGALRDYLVVKAPHRDAEGRVIGVVGISRDISERKRHEHDAAVLAEIGAVLSASLDTSTLAARLAEAGAAHLGAGCLVDVFQDDGSVHEHAAVRGEQGIAALPPRRLLPGPLRTRAREAERPLLVTLDEAAVGELGAGDDALAALLRAHAGPLVLAPLLARDRAIGLFGLVGAAEDGQRGLALVAEVAWRAGFALDNARLFEAAQRAVRGRDEVMAVVSHDLKNPLNAIVLAAATLPRLVPGEPRLGLIAGQIKRAVSQMNQLISGLLDAAAIEGGRIRLDRRPVELAALITDTLEVQRPLWTDRGQTLTCSVDPALGSIPADPDRLAQVLSNLVGNAIKFTPEGGHIAVEARAAGEAVEIAVRDDGPGIPEDQQPHVFERYWQQARGAARGTGLGLYIARGIVEAHGGRIGLASRPGAGSTFVVTLPRA